MGAQSREATELSLISTDEVRAIIQALPTRKRAAISKALSAAAQHIKDSHGNYEKAFEFAGLVVENEWMLGDDLERMDAAGMLHAPSGPRKKNDGVMDYADLGLGRQRAHTARRIRERYDDDSLHEWVQSQYDAEKKKLPRIGTIASEVRKAAQEEKIEQLRQREAMPSDGIYDVVVIDPPWPMEKIEREVAPEQVAFDYPTMDEDQLEELEIPAAEDCHLWLWTTHKFLPMALRLLTAWEFKYVCTFVWHKPGGFQPFGLPQYNCEFAIYARRGSPVFADVTDFNVCFAAPRKSHSVKPQEFYDTVLRVTAGKRLDMFNRREIEGFDGWGNESPE